MGYYSNKDIALVSDPNRLSFSQQPNFIIFSSVKSTEKDAFFEASITLKTYNKDEIIPKVSDQEEKAVSITLNFDNSSIKYSFMGTSKRIDVNTQTFFIAKAGENIIAGEKMLTEKDALLITTQNLYTCLLANKYLKSNYDIWIDSKVDSDMAVVAEPKILIKAKGSGPQYNFNITSGISDAHYRLFDYTTTQVTSSDTIDRGLGVSRIDVDIYDDLGIPFADMTTENICSAGKYVASLSKAYFGAPLWFDLNNLMSKKNTYSTAFLDTDTAWVDSGTCLSYRLVAKRNTEANNQLFYYSDILYVINGGRFSLSEKNSLESIDDNGFCYSMNFDQDFVFGDLVGVKALTSNTRRNHVKGQSQYFNFIAKNVSNISAEIKDAKVELYYELYTQSGNYIGDYTSHAIPIQNLKNINTAKLNIERALPLYKDVDGLDKTVGRIDVCLSILNGDEEPIKISNTLTYDIQPNSVHTVYDFAFLNSLGGWDSMNFEGLQTTDYSTSASTSFKTLLPNYQSSTEIESVAFKSVQENKTVKTAPITLQQVEWLKELSSSTAVYEIDTKRYVIIDDMNLKYNTGDDLYQVEMKFHYSDSSK